MRERDSLPINAKLPEDLEPTAEDRASEKLGTPEIKIGQSGWTWPMDMEADSHRDLWMTLKMNLQAKHSDDASMWVKRTEAGFIVNISKVTEREWDIEGAEPPDYYTDLPEEWAPVIELSRSHSALQEAAQPNTLRALGQKILSFLD